MTIPFKGWGVLVPLMRAIRLSWTASPGWSLVSLGLIFLQSICPLGVLYLTKLTLDAVTVALRAPGEEHYALLFRWVILTAIAGWAALATRSLANYANETQGEIVSEHVQALIAEKACQLDLTYYEDAKYFDTLHQTQLEAPYRPPRIVASLAQIIQNALSLIAIGGLILASFHWTSVLAVIGIAFLGLLVRLRNVRLVYQWRKERAPQDRQLSYYNWLLNSAVAAKEIRLFDLGRLFAGRANILRANLRRERTRIGAWRTAGELLTQACASGAIVLAFLALIRDTLRHVLTLGGLVMNLQALQRAASLLQELISSGSQLYEHGLFLNRLYIFLALETRVGDRPDPKPLPPAQKRVIRFENVTFRYKTSPRLVLQGVNLEIEPGEMVAFVGDNGAGKSTLIKLLCRLYDPDEGSISLGGIDLRDFKREELWKHVSVLFQDFVQYQTTVSENIWFGASHKPAYPPGIRSAAVQGGSDGFVEKLPRAYEQNLGTLFEGGVELSGGQWQKIAISRAFYRDAPVVILDEPTSALDVKSEHDVFSRFKELSRGKTSIIISHRLSTVRMADRIFFLENGRIAEVGDHDELINLGGGYSDLFATQASNYR